MSPAAAQTARLDGEQPEDREVQAEAPDRPKDMPLSILPEPRSIDLPAPRPAALEAIDELLADIKSDRPLTRSRAQSLLARARMDWVSGLERRANQLAERADRQKMKATFERTIQMERAPGALPTDDYLNELMALPAPQDTSWQAVVQLLAINRMLTAIGSADAARVVIFIYSRFGEFIRIDCQRQLDAMGDRATAALIDARRHPAEKISSWAERLLSLRQKLDPHQAVDTDDSTALADTLVALGRSRDPELTQLLLSFAASDRDGVRRAAREGLVLLGEVGAWQLKDAYQNITGRLPPRDWTWKRTARELFTEYDRLELEEAYALVAQGQRAQAEKKYAEMAQAFNKVLALVPSFAQPELLAEGYLSAARAMTDQDPRFALDLAFRAEQLLQDPARKNEAEALRRLLDAKLLRQQGWVDQTELSRARELDPTLKAPIAELGSSKSTTRAWGAGSRYLVAGLVSVLALLSAAWIFVTTWWRRSRAGQPDPAPEEPS